MAGVPTIGSPAVAMCGFNCDAPNYDTINQNMGSIFNEPPTNNKKNKTKTASECTSTPMTNSKSPVGVMLPTEVFLHPEKFLTKAEHHNVIEEATKIISTIDAMNYGYKTSTIFELPAKDREEYEKQLKALSTNPTELPAIITAAISSACDYSLGTNEEMLFGALNCINKYNYKAVEHLLLNRSSKNKSLMDYINDELSGKDKKEAIAIVEKAKAGAMELERRISYFNKEINQNYQNYLLKKAPKRQ